MLSSIAASFLLGLVSLTHAAPTAIVLTPRASASDVGDAQNSWAADTSRVSQFLSAAPDLSGSDLVEQAQAALDIFNGELAYKAVLDGVFGGDPAVQAAAATLARPGTFQFVANGLQQFTTEGAGMDKTAVDILVSRINRARCRDVLPAIDAYLKAASAFLNNGLLMVANRPDNCQ
ncbi:hypothetical protein F4821DRAFT_234832 [Hypoxylon rubiginosum]|uniref:Uncharacterized protein n=1 Tax=Hypoxylon rubiginosum TaxID=110542 RepID=A0ACC0D684_9PEZI|nr:hypothetical protein F4821DRAFT_234832 [Hypoxylon rubiginosum]